MSGQHRPEPWILVETKDGFELGTGEWSESDNGFEEYQIATFWVGYSAAKANATLAKAAPDLLEAIEAAINISDKYVGDTGRTDECQAVYDQCRAALAKARGQA